MIRKTIKRAFQEIIQTLILRTGIFNNEFKQYITENPDFYKVVYCPETKKYGIQIILSKEEPNINPINIFYVCNSYSEALGLCATATKKWIISQNSSSKSSNMKKVNRSWQPVTV